MAKAERLCTQPKPPGRAPKLLRGRRNDGASS
jgi:hypothetical protein